ncbi:MAG: Eco57I restriction-modification methylase domain-containing protein [Methanotrichaceae archaeon]|nr:Eco57I restriction-modification methylase domain-containing protein [Methanotrichaceae archaeon]
MAAPKEIVDLVERFKSYEDAYKSASYNEARLRQEFINPFFKAMGWDVFNEQGYAEAYKEVIHEDSLEVEGQKKAPDYTFRIGPMRKFFVETKKPSMDIKADIHPAFQVRRYAWSAKLPLSILTDFEEFSVYDCRDRPVKTDKASKARVLYITYDEYIDRWDEIASIFSQEAILKGSFDKFAEENKAKRGTAEVDAAFLEEMASWRDLLARNLALRNPDLSQEELNYAVQATIDRIVFLRICEDRGIERYGQLQALLDGERVYPRLRELFHRADEKYNSGIFHFQPEAGRGPPDRLSLGLTLDDKALKEIIRRLYYPDSPYEFSVLPAEILGQVYEQFLGQVIRLTPGHRAVVEHKPEVKKAGGVFYTPSYIVKYIVENTVGRLLEGMTPAQAAELRILDPACGSGSFLIEAYQYLMNWHRDWYVEKLVPLLANGHEAASPEVVRLIPTTEQPQASGKGRAKKGKKGQAVLPIYPSQSGEWLLTSAERKRILLNNIYGVDIDSQAVEVTLLSLLLKVLEGENEQTLDRQMKLFQERALPDLGENIKCGNSLVGPDILDSGELAPEEILRINPFDWGREFSQIMGRGGFDVVIGNPPYVRQESLGSLKTYLQGRYQVYRGVADLYAYFIEKGVTLLRNGGQFSYIVSNKWMRANYGQPLRRWLKDQRIEEIVDFGDLHVFTKATTYPCIIHIQKRPSAESFLATQVNTLDFSDLISYVEEHSHKVRVASLDDSGWSLEGEDIVALLEKVKSRGITLGEYVGGKIYYGIKTGLNQAFVIDGQTRERLIADDPKSAELIKPFLAGRDIKRYQPPTTEKYLVFTRRGVNIKDYPAIERHLAQYKQQLMPRPKDWTGGKWGGRKPGAYQWYEVQDTIDYYAEFEKPKILWPEIAGSARFTFDGSYLYGNNKLYLIPITDYYLLGLLNSSLMKLFIHNVCTDLQGNSYNFSAIFIMKSPIRTIDFSDPQDVARHDHMVSLVERMLDLHKQLSESKTPQEQTALQRRIEATDKQIDVLVYELYDLTEDEIKIVEGQST